MALATEVLTLFLRCPGTPVSSAPYIPPAISRPPTNLALLYAPTGEGHDPHGSSRNFEDSVPEDLDSLGPSERG
eukprot:10715009-Heterocapsa_arctica.AAC.1